MHETCDRCGPAVQARYRADRLGELYLCRAIADAALALALAAQGWALWLLGEPVFSADNLKFPGDDRRLDLTDVFIFTSADDPDKTVVIIDSNPTSAPPPIPAPVTGPEFYPGAFYRINIDNDGDNQADVAFTFVFSEYANGRLDRDRLLRHRRPGPSRP